MRINVYAEELPDVDDSRSIERVQTTADTGRTFFGARLYLKSASELHDEPGDDDRSAITIWGPRAKVAALLRRMAERVDGHSDDEEAERLLRLTCLQVVDGVEYESLEEMRSHQSSELADIALAIQTAWNRLLIELENKQ